MTTARITQPSTPDRPVQQLRREGGPVTVKGVARRAALLEAGRKVFEAKGYLDARVSDIVDEASVAQGTFYTYFDSKDAIFVEVATDATQQMMMMMHRAGPYLEDPFQRIRTANERFVAAYRPNARIISLIEQVSTFTPEMKHLRLAVREAFVNRAAHGIREMQAEGLADKEIDPVTTAEVLGAMVDHTCFVWMTLGKEFEEDALLDTLSVVWARAIGLDVPVPPRRKKRATKAKKA